MRENEEEQGSWRMSRRERDLYIKFQNEIQGRSGRTAERVGMVEEN